MTPEPSTVHPDVNTQLHALYDELEADIQRARPVCLVSGRCCRFREYDHTLFLSRLELDLLLREAPPPVRPLDDGSTCPWQDPDGRCRARNARPLGCRLFYCDPGFATDLERLSQHYHDRLKILTDSLHRPWSYAPLHQHLREARSEGRFPAPDDDGAR